MFQRVRSLLGGCGFSVGRFLSSSRERLCCHPQPDTANYNPDPIGMPMTGFLKVIVGCFIAFVTSSCATGQRFTQLRPNMAPADPEFGRIFFYRPSMFGSAVRTEVKLNDESVGEAVSWGFFYVDRPPGNYQVVTSTEVDRKLSFVLEKSQTRFVRFSASLGFFLPHIYGELVDPDAAQSEIVDCNYTGTVPLTSSATP